MKVVQEVQVTADTVLKIRPIHYFVTGTSADLSLYGSEDERDPDNDGLEGCDIVTSTRCTHRETVCSLS